MTTGQDHHARMRAIGSTAAPEEAEDPCNEVLGRSGCAGLARGTHPLPTTPVTFSGNFPTATATDRATMTTVRPIERRLMALDSTASTRWQGDLMSGSGVTTLSSGAAAPLAVDWKARSEEHGGKTSPEELIAAAHASCFSMALSHGLAQSGTPPTSLDVTATATFVPGTGITGIVLVLSGDVPGLDEDGFREAAEAAKVGCPVSQALAGNVPITLEIR